MSISRAGRLGVAMVILVASSWLAASPASAAEVLDQQTYVTSSGAAIQAPGMAQTFRAGATGSLTRVRVYMSYTGTHDVGEGPLTFEIRAVGATSAPTGVGTTGTGEVLASRAIPLSEVTPDAFAISGQSAIDIVFDDPAAVSAGTSYAVVLVQNFVTGVFWMKNDGESAPAPYPGGQLWISTAVNGSFHAVPDGDLALQTYVDTGDLNAPLESLSGQVLDLSIGADHTQTLIDLLLTTNEYLFEGEVEDAIDKLYDFIDKLEDYVENGTISQTAGEGLIDLTEAIIDLVEQLSS